MDHEPEEVIKQQMLETRASLTEKLETLEQQVVGTVHSATTAVTDTVESVKGAVQQTVELAKASVHDTVEAVKDTFDLSRQVREHPWAMVGGSVTVGFAAGCLLSRATASTRERLPNGGVPTLSTLTPRFEAERDGGARHRMAEQTRSTSADAGGAHQGVLGDLGQRFDTEIHKLKGLALGTILGVVRDMITNSAPPQVGSELAEIIDSATVKLGGQPIHGPVLNLFEHDVAGRQEGQQSRRSAQSSPMGATRNAAMSDAGPID